jgi:hypothetical protein
MRFYMDGAIDTIRNDLNRVIEDTIIQDRCLPECPVMIGRGMKESQSSLLHVHLCAHCSAVFRREEIEGRVHTT